MAHIAGIPIEESVLALAPLAAIVLGFFVRWEGR
jgi:hypothetical protein